MQATVTPGRGLDPVGPCFRTRARTIKIDLSHNVHSVHAFGKTFMSNSGKQGTGDTGSWLWLAATGAAAFVVVLVAVYWAQSMTPQATAKEDAFRPTAEGKGKPPGESPPGMVWIPGGEFSMGCDDPTSCPCGGPDAMRDARPIHRVYLDGYWMDRTEVTNQQFREFTDSTGYVTIAEQTPRPEDFPGAPHENLVAGSTVYTPTAEPVPLNNHYQWWSYRRGANWQHPEGPDSDLAGKENYPVVHIAYEDAVAYCKWSGKQLPTEAQWEFAARGGQAGKLYAWGDELKPRGKWMANIFEGAFPLINGDTGEDGFVGIAPVAQFPPNAYGLYDLAGNVWEWCSDWYRPDYYEMLAMAYHVARNPRGPDSSFDPAEPNVPKRVHRGGSFLCTDKYCTRYMVGSRGKGEVSTGSNHVGFRCVKVSESNPSSP
jgi:sulfatase modifying factor 1